MIVISWYARPTYLDIFDFCLKLKKENQIKI